MASGISSQIKTKRRVISICTTAGDVLQRNEDTENTRSKYLLANFKNPKESTEQKVLVDLYKYSNQDLHALQKMHEINHVNVLKCYQYQKFKSENNEFYRVFLEEFTGCLKDILEKRINTLHHNQVFPSQSLTKLVRSIVDVLRYLHRKNLYHGALSWTTLLYLNVEGTNVVKLAHFCKKDELEICEAQIEDWQAVAAMLREIMDQFAGASQLHTDHLERAITFFQNVTKIQMSNIPNLVQDLDFFWMTEDRQKYATKVFHWCENDCYFQEIEKSNIVLKPWHPFSDSSGAGDKLLRIMNNFKDKDGKSARDLDYNRNNATHFLRFISGMYAHPQYVAKTAVELFKPNHFFGLAYIDGFVCKNYPDLFYNLRELEKQHQFIT